MPAISPSPQAIALADDLRAVLKHLIRRMRQEDEGQSAGGLGLHQTLLLARIGQHPGIGVAELARLEKLRGPTMSGHVKALENAGLVRRAPDPADKRRAGLHLTTPGRQALEAVRSRRRDWLAAELARLPDEGAAAVRQALVYLKEIGA
ncbi:MAG: MarR family transcriptional regulator [Acidovorax sp.]